MAKKDDLIEEAKGLGIELTGDETVADLEKAIDAAEKPSDGGLKRSKVNRGSRRRIERAMARFNAEMEATIKELDMQAFVADENGERVEEWDAVKMLREAKSEVNSMVNQLLAG